MSKLFWAQGGERFIKFFEKYKRNVEQKSLRQFFLRGARGFRPKTLAELQIIRA
jgi:hypothetical protein